MCPTLLNFLTIFFFKRQKKGEKYLTQHYSVPSLTQSEEQTHPDRSQFQ
jgi:hypothetical protein